MSLLYDASLIITPNAYKESKLYALKPQSGLGDMTVTRATTATRVNSQGFIEGTPYNLLQYSEQFHNTAWTKTTVSVTANTTTAPNGTLTADTLSVGIDPSPLRHRLFSANHSSQVIGTPYTGSFYLKANQHQWIQVIGIIGFSIGVWANFDLINGVIGNTGGVDTTATITNVGNGWYRCTVSGVATATLTTGFEVLVINNTNGSRYPSYQSLVAQDVCYVWGAQLVQGSTPKDYFPTTNRLNVPRIDYSNGGCPSILVEPQRTNLALRSEEFNDAYWTKANLNTSGTPSWINALLSPDGTQNAEILIPNNTTNAHQISKADAGYVADTNFTFSCFLKENGFRYAALTLVLRIGGTFQETASALIDLQSKTITISTSNIIFRDVKVQNLGDFQNGFTRYSISVKTPILGSDRLDIQIRCVDSSGASILGDNVGGFGVWGAQLEAGSNATSYIPTIASTVTRNADVISKTGISDLIGQSEGTIFVDFNLSTIGANTGGGIIELSPSGGSDSETNRILIWKNISSKQIAFQIRAGSTTNIFNSIFSAPSDGKVKVGIAYKSGDTILSVNGSIVARSETFNFSQTLNFIKLGSYASVNFSINDTINQVLLLKTRLSNAELTQLTTL
jgi:hypothetical protein